MDAFLPEHFFDLSFFEHADLFQNCQFVWEVLPKIAEFLAQHKNYKIDGKVSPLAFLENPEMISIGSGTVVEAGAYLRGPCLIGKNCTVRQGVYVRGNLITGDDCVIGHDTEIKNVLMLNGSKAPHFAYLGDTVLGNKVNLGAGTICANLKLNKAVIEVAVNNTRMSTGLKKFGAILGDRTQTGCNSVLNPGTICGKDVFIYPSLNVGGIIPANSLVKPSQSFVITQKK